MRTYKLTHVGDDKLLRDLSTLVARDRSTTAEILAHIAEVDTRRLYAPLGFQSMFAYCTESLHLSEGATYKRIQAARAARKRPALFEAIAEGRLHLTAVVFLAPHLTEDNADELIAAATHKTKSEVEIMLAQRFPRPDVPSRVRAVASRKTKFDHAQLVPEPVVTPTGGTVHTPAPGPASASASAPARVPARASATPTKVQPIAPKRFALHTTIDQGTHDKLRYAQALLRHQVPSGDLAQIFDCALDALVAKLEKRKFAACTPRASSRRATTKRTIPARVRRAVWKRDNGRCTFVGANGHRCGAQAFLEFDHIDPVARGGESTVAGMRLRCRAHNQYEAECVFGAGFMDAKREAARRRRASGCSSHVPAPAG